MCRPVCACFDRSDDGCKARLRAWKTRKVNGWGSWGAAVGQLECCEVVVSAAPSQRQGTKMADFEILLGKFLFTMFC